MRFLVDYMLERSPLGCEVRFEPDVGIVGHSFGGWTALAAAETERRIGAVVALAPAGNSNPKPGMLRAPLDFDWGRDVPTLYLVAEDDVSLPLAGMYELFARTRATKRFVILRQADHLHFVDDVEQEHEIVRDMTFSRELAWLPKEMRPIEQLCSGHTAHSFTCVLTLCHMDATLRHKPQAETF
ncbi:MAG: hypothetical protein M3T49_02285 [Candidatus Eremiobacteraeota bacterium]|nr:hypothetical protein [Candidatus Eremiobacteraeota bacterium]